MSTSIPLVDLGWQHAQVADEVRAGFERVFAATSFVLGPEAERFEQEYARYTGVRHCVGVGNGTDAVELALRAAGIGRGDEVVIPANTFVATAEAVLRSGAELVLADCDEHHLLDPESVAPRVTARTRAVVPVHLYGQVAPMKAVADAAGDGVVVVEDAAQSQGATQDGRASGSFGVAAATSFYPGKNLGAYGDAGAVTTDSDEVAGRLRALRNHGGVRRYEHGEFGVNSRLDGLQGVVLSAKLARLDGWNALRRAAAARYEELLADLPEVTLPRTAPGNEHVWHLYVVRVPRRDEVLTTLNAAGIGAGIHYPAPVHLLPPFAHLGHGPGSFPRAEASAAEILSLPLFPGITPEQQQRVAAELRSALR
ncbi:MAG TPA: DegT/DnrJ/EryC1/StrS family aminotransferase [Mycobacteriales bacterium]|jgi:dTDP-4-amino-4,6-dideoxygalactose transaminase|nr:DegT/DnrJ/EryC1/StrS family aminotransferase [Mycobacteriales bacterium]